MPITVGPFCLTHPVNFPCGRKPEYSEKTHDYSVFFITDVNMSPGRKISQNTQIRSEVIPLAAPERLSSDGDEFGAGFNVNTITQIHFRTRGSKYTIVDMDRGSLDLPKSLSNGF